MSLSDLIRMSFTSSTSEIESMRSVGLETMSDILQKFGNVMDPDYQGHYLLEQYQAQIGSSLRPAFAAEASPKTTTTACSLLLAYLTSSFVEKGTLDKTLGKGRP